VDKYFRDTIRLKTIISQRDPDKAGDLVEAVEQYQASANIQHTGTNEPAIPPQLCLDP